MRRGGIGLCVATQIARYVNRSTTPARLALAGAGVGDDAGQLAWYREMEQRGELVAIAIARRARSRISRDGRQRRRIARTLPIGYVLSLEGADSIVTLAHLERACERRPARGGPGALRARHLRAGHGRDRRHRRRQDASCCRNGPPRDDPRRDAPLRRQLLGSDGAFHGPVWASHSNCRALVPHNRQFSDEQIRAWSAAAP